MRTARSALLVATLLAPPLARSLAAQPAPDALRADTLKFGRFGRFVVYRRAERPSRVVILVSGDDGWGAASARLARELATDASTTAAVVGVDGRAYLAALARAGDRYIYRASDFEQLAQYAEQRLRWPRYEIPTLVGDGSGATLAYATLAQGPPNTFRGAVGVAFAPTLALGRALCAGPGGLHDSVVTERVGARPRRVVHIATSHATPAPWVAVADAGHVREALASIYAERAHDVAATAGAVRDLPLVEVPASAPAAASAATLLAVIVSGDGGWASIDRSLAAAMAARGVPVAGWSSLQYFWHGSTPDSSSRDLARVMRHYTTAWGRPRVLLVGYSLGADVLPFMASRLPGELRERVAAVALIAPSRTVAFEFHVADWLGRGPDEFRVAPEIRALRAALGTTPVLCVYGTDEVSDSPCPSLGAAVTSVVMPGGHHFGGDYAGLAARVLGAVR